MNNVRRQSTINAPVFTAGIELHGGKHTRVVMRPAPMGTGLVFVRTDINDRDNRIPVTPDAVTSVKNCTTLSNVAGVKVATIEHLLAALAASGIDNLFIELDGEELPALDGSAEPFLKLIEQVGIQAQAAPRLYVKVLKTVEVRKGNVEQAMRVLKRKVQKEGLVKELRERQYFEKPSEKKRRKKKENIANCKKLKKKLERQRGY